MSTYTEIRLKERPKGHIDESTFESVTLPIPDKKDLKKDEVLVQVEYVAIDPAMRGWLNDARSYVPPVPLGSRMRAFATARVVASTSADFAPDDVVSGHIGWTEYAVLPAKQVEKLNFPPGYSSADAFGLFGSTSLTAYFGMIDIGDPKAGDTVVVSAAAGATGSIAGQLAKAKGARVIGIAGTDEKCDWITKELGFDASINYKKPDWKGRLAAETPEYINVYYDNVGGEILEACLYRAATFARFVMCGAISSYNAKTKPTGPSSMFNITAQRVKMQGFIIFDFKDRYPEAMDRLVTLHKQGKVKAKLHVVDTGIDGCVEALKSVFAGENTGRLVVRVGQSNQSKL